MTTWQVAEIHNVAYRKAASVQNAVSGFRKAGMWSFTIYVLQDSDFAAATVTNVMPEAAQEHNPMPPLTPALAVVVMVIVQEHNPTPHLIPADGAQALTVVAMETVPELSPPKKETS